MRLIRLDFDPSEPPARRPRAGRGFVNVPVNEDGHVFDSLAERRRYRELRLLERGGAIVDLRVHPPYDIVVNGRHICRYIADFSYSDEAGRLRVEDVKAPPSRTPQYHLKRKLMLACLGIRVEEVKA